MFGFGREGTSQRAESLPFRRELFFEYRSPSALAVALSADISAVLKLRRAEYRSLYSTGDFLKCVAFFGEDYSEIYLRFGFFRGGELVSESRFYRVDPRIFLEMMKNNDD